MVNNNFRKDYRRQLNGGYRKYRRPSIFRGQELKPKKEFKLPKITFKVLFWIVVFSAIVYYLFFSGKFQIADVMVEGNKMVSADKIASVVSKNKNILLFGSKKTKQRILQDNPEIKNVEIYRGLPNAVKIVVLEHEGKMLWQSGDSTYLISTQGAVAKKLEANDSFNLPKVVDKRYLPFQVGSNLLSSNFVAFINNVNDQFFNVTNIKPTYFEVDETTFDVNLYTEAGFYVKLNSLRSSSKQLDNLKMVLVARRDAIKEYVDLRIDGWAYYK